MSLIQSLAAQLPPTDLRSIAEIDQEIRDELEFHVAMRTEDNLRSGMTPDQARQNAVSCFGDFQTIQNGCRRALLGERIMWQRIQTVLFALLVVAVVGMGLSMYQLQRSNNTALTELATAVRSMGKLPASPEPSSNVLADRPHVVHTWPEQGALDVDPATHDIRVTFDKPMTNGSWSWVRSSSNEFPDETGLVHYLDDMKTCVMPVKLEPGKKYTVWFNTSKYQNFKDSDGLPAEPYGLTFTTAQ